MRRAGALLASFVIALGLPAVPALAQSAGDRQYVDPCANGACDPAAGGGTGGDVTREPPEADDDGGGTMLVAVAGGGALLLAAAVFGVLRRGDRPARDPADDAPPEHRP